MPNMIEAQAGLAQSITDHTCCLQTSERVYLFCQHSEGAKSRSTFGDCYSCMVQRPWRYSMRLLISWLQVCDIVMLFIVAVSLCLCSFLWLIRSVHFAHRKRICCCLLIHIMFQMVEIYFTLLFGQNQCYLARFWTCMLTMSNTIIENIAVQFLMGIQRETLPRQLSKHAEQQNGFQGP